MWKIIAVVIVILAGIFIYSQNNTESNAQKLSECKSNASKIHDVEQETAPEITGSNGSQNSEVSYSKRLATCQANYGKK